MKYIFTSESVTNGHPDKICDIISDSILDAALLEDKNSRMAVEASIKDDLLFIYGEATTNTNINYEQVALNVIKEIGYREKYSVMTKITRQSAEINKAVNKSLDNLGAGDQGIMFGYACDETEEYMPMPIYYAHKLAKQLEEIIKKFDFLQPDGKTQVSVEYEDGKPIRIDTIVVSVQHKESAEYKKIYEIVLNEVVKKVIPQNLLDENTKYLINPSGSFILGGSFGDSGTTGRKIVCDTYGGMGRIGGGCLSSKDPTKVDRSAAYYCRYVAKNIVANKLATKCEIQVSYAIGQPEPISIYIDTFNTGIYTDDHILHIIRKNFSFSVSNIITELNLLRPIYKETACYGHFGRAEFPWEKVKKIILTED